MMQSERERERERVALSKARVEWIQKKDCSCCSSIVYDHANAVFNFNFLFDFDFSVIKSKGAFLSQPSLVVCVIGLCQFIMG